MVNGKRLDVGDMAELDFTLYLVLKLHWPHNLHTLARLPSCLWLTRFLVRLD